MRSSSTHLALQVVDCRIHFLPEGFQRALSSRPASLALRSSAAIPLDMETNIFMTGSRFAWLRDHDLDVMKYARPPTMIVPGFPIWESAFRGGNKSHFRVSLEALYVENKE